MLNIKLLICYHKKATLFKDDILTPIHVGRTNAAKRMEPENENYRWLMENMIGDDTGDNISSKNDTYNEMTALYWAWKNYDTLGNPDYIGLMHYRRHFVLQENVQAVYNIKDFDESTYYDVLNYSKENMQKLVEGCDFLTHIGKVKNVYKHYIENQRKEDIDLANEIVLEKYPEYKEILDSYYAGDYSNFCNMNIFSREIFFAYCEWIFSILEEFEKRVDVSEKRFFISERLTGVFLAKLMSDKSLKHKILPIAFLEEPTEVPVAMWIDEANILSNAVTMTSILEAANGYHLFHFYLFYGKETRGELKDRYKIFEKKYAKCSVEFVLFDRAADYLPLFIAQLLPQINKCIYISGQVIALFDIGEFYRICSTDDYFIAGVPQEHYDPAETNKKISNELLVMNCKRLRQHMIAEKTQDLVQEKLQKIDLLNELCQGEIGYIPWYLYTSEKLGDENTLFHKEKSRIKIQQEVLWRPFLVYDRRNPIENNQGILSIFWWNAMKNIPLCFQVLKTNTIVLQTLYASQQIEINGMKEIDKEVPVRNPQEDWHNYGLWGKLVFYYKHNGLKNTVTYAGTKLFGKRG